MDRLLTLADADGVRVMWRNLGKRRGEYKHTARLITINPRMSDLLQRSTLAHELGHAYYGDQWTDDPAVKDAQERRANRYAARLLISPLEYAVAEAMVGPSVGALAKELGVSTYIVEAWQAAPPVSYFQLKGLA
ncbi:ImmA/IrrE family metallo-endopeptidase [Timonella senegalensis]|uniref:ImmA/IrrE family metallo-endopeptidase n=1 Tax=Timonella senegalensis TaxID=1465825 RepID=UPI0028A9BE09|nr:ImmA/IrrE family metallo-endopeptidase [Timonella senegalensis]